MSFKKYKSKRFNTEVQLTIEGLTNPYRHESVMNNLSRSGAMCTFRENEPVRVGDVVQLKVFLDKLGKKHNVSAKVIWIEKNSPTTKEAGYEFITAEEMYSSVLNSSR